MHLVVSFLVLLVIGSISGAPVDSDNETEVHFGYDTENGQHRTEEIKYQNSNEPKKEEESVEYRGGYSFVSADGYEYTVLYKANKNGYQPYVTARKLKEN